MSSVHTDSPDDLHPFECDGPGKCIHHDRKVTETHDPAKCPLCDPDYDRAHLYGDVA